jgi:hypothetical protein
MHNKTTVSRLTLRMDLAIDNNVVILYFLWRNGRKAKWGETEGKAA